MRWPHYKHIFFDCDSTLTTVEGIDILAETAGKKWDVEALTKAAMDGQLDLGEVYGKRLQTVSATRAQIRNIRQSYKHNIVEDAKEVIAALQALDHKVYIISGGLAEPVAEFGIFLGVPREQIRAVEVDYDQLDGEWWQNMTEDLAADSGRYIGYIEGDLTATEGKANVVRDLLGEQNGRSLLIGDGSSDLRASAAVDLFVGFGGVESRQHVLDEAPVFVHSSSIAPLLVLAAGPAAYRLVKDTPHETVFTHGLKLIQSGAVTFQNGRLQEKFDSALAKIIQ